MKQLNKFSISSIAIEVASIIVAVVLGFVVNEWREVIHNKSTADSALQKIVIEIKKNDAQLKEKQKYYFRMISALDSLEAIYGNNKFKQKKIPGWNGLNPPLLSSSSYKTASTIGVFSNIDFDTADNISKAYLLQDYLQQLGTTTINSIVSGQLQTSTSFKLVFIIHTEIIDGLLHTYQHVLTVNLKKYARKYETQD